MQLTDIAELRLSLAILVIKLELAKDDDPAFKTDPIPIIVLEAIMLDIARLVTEPADAIVLSDSRLAIDLKTRFATKLI